MKKMKAFKSGSDGISQKLSLDAMATSFLKTKSKKKKKKPKKKHQAQKKVINELENTFKASMENHD